VYAARARSLGECRARPSAKRAAEFPLAVVIVDFRTRHMVISVLRTFSGFPRKAGGVNANRLLGMFVLVQYRLFIVRGIVSWADPSVDAHHSLG
jgi:hypothetical protein